MAAITATAVSVGILVGNAPLYVCVTSSGAVAAYNVASSIWNVLPMVTT